MPYYVYLLATRRHGALYLGVTNDLVRRVAQHKAKAIPGFTGKYGVDCLVWFEVHDDPSEAISREKAIKKVAKRLENPSDRGAKPGMVGSLFQGSPDNASSSLAGSVSPSRHGS